MFILQSHWDVSAVSISELICLWVCGAWHHHSAPLRQAGPLTLCHALTKAIPNRDYAQISQTDLLTLNGFHTIIPAVQVLIQNVMIFFIWRGREGFKCYNMKVDGKWVGGNRLFMLKNNDWNVVLYIMCRKCQRFFFFFFSILLKNVCNLCQIAPIYRPENRSRRFFFCRLRPKYWKVKNPADFSQ